MNMPCRADFGGLTRWLEKTNTVRLGCLRNHRKLMAVSYEHRTLFMKLKLLSFAVIAALPTFSPAAGPLTVTAVNKLQLSRPSQTIEVSGKDLAPLEAKSLESIHVKDSAGKELLCQAVDTDFDES